ncbi:hypothetical protein DBP21_17065 [Streptomyces sp. CS147]|nr:hypothetical protein DBP21_17065 [Streptomyces sp. CS147]
MVFDAAADLAVGCEGMERAIEWLEAHVAAGSIVASASLVRILLNGGGPKRRCAGAAKVLRG